MSTGGPGVPVDPSGWAEPAGWTARARRLGPLRYSDLGRRRLEPPPAPPALARWLAGRLDRWWAASGEPDPFTVVVVSGDEGELASALAGWGPRCLPALRYVMVHPDHRDPPPAVLAGVPLENPAFLYPSAQIQDADDDQTGERPPATGIGPLFTFLADVPALPDGHGAIVAVGWLSRLPFDVYQGPGPSGWSEVRLIARGDELVEIEVPASAPPPIRPATPGRHVVATGAVEWLRRTIVANAGGVLAVLEADPPMSQLSAVRRPAAGPEPVEGTGLSSVEWRMGPQ